MTIQEQRPESKQNTHGIMRLSRDSWHWYHLTYHLIYFYMNTESTNLQYRDEIISRVTSEGKSLLVALLKKEVWKVCFRSQRRYCWRVWYDPSSSDIYRKKWLDWHANKQLPDLRHNPSGDERYLDYILPWIYVSCSEKLAVSHCWHVCLPVRSLANVSWRGCIVDIGFRECRKSRWQTNLIQPWIYAVVKSVCIRLEEVDLIGNLRLS